MALPAGTFPILGPIVDTSGALLPASTDLRDAGAVSLRDGNIQKVNSDGDAWEDVASGSNGGGGGGSGAVTLTPQTAADKNFSQTTGLGTSQNGVAQNNDLFDTDITLPTDIPDDELFYLRATSNAGESLIGLTKAHLDELTEVTPVTWASTFTAGVTADRAGDDRNAYSFPIGQNRGLLLGISDETPYRLQWGGTNTGMTIDLQIITVTAGDASESGQESPGNAGVAEKTPDLVTVVLWKWTEDVLGIPDEPDAHWRFDDEWDGTTPESSDGGGWYTSRGTALDEADNNPDFSQSTWTLWIATEQVRRRVVDDEYSYTDGGYSLVSVFDDQYSASSDGPWNTTYDEDNHNWMRMRNSIGEYTPPIAIGDTSDIAWEAFLTEHALYMRPPSNANGSNSKGFVPPIDIDKYDAILLRIRPFTLDGTDVDEVGTEGDVILNKPPEGWPIVENNNDEKQKDNFFSDKTYQWHYDVRGTTPLVCWRMGVALINDFDDSEGNVDSQTYDGPGIPNSEQDLPSYIFVKTAGRFKFYGSSATNVNGIRLFNQPTNNSAYNRVHWWMYGLKGG